MSRKIFALMSVVALVALGATAAAMRPAPSASTAAKAGPDVETKVIHKTIRIKRRAAAEPSTGGAARSSVPASAAAPPRLVAQAPISQPAPVHDDDDDYEDDERGDDERGDDDVAEHGDEGEHEEFDD